MSISLSPNAADPEIKYDFFLSVRGEDTRHNSTSHLYAALSQKQTQIFIEDELDREDEIAPSLYRAIEASKISFIIFSNGYASSRGCLDELVKILECNKREESYAVMPVLDHVDPSDVQKLSEDFGKDFKELEECY